MTTAQAMSALAQRPIDREHRAGLAAHAAQVAVLDLTADCPALQRQPDPIQTLGVAALDQDDARAGRDRPASPPTPPYAVAGVDHRFASHPGGPRAGSILGERRAEDDQPGTHRGQARPQASIVGTLAARRLGDRAQDGDPAARHLGQHVKGRSMVSSEDL